MGSLFGDDSKKKKNTPAPPPPPSMGMVMPIGQDSAAATSAASSEAKRAALNYGRDDTIKNSVGALGLADTWAKTKKKKLGA